MKKTVMFFLTIALIITSIQFTSLRTDAKHESWWVNENNKMDSIKIEWNYKGGAKKYQVYRAVAKNRDTFPSKSKFKRIKTTKKKKYIDKKNKYGKYYAYYIKALNKKNNKVSDSYNYSKETKDISFKGLAMPEIKAGGYKKYYKKGNYQLHLYCSLDTGEKIKFYRKTKGKKYKAIKVKKVEYDQFVDKKVKMGKTYYYKSRTSTKYKGKKIQSAYSEVIIVYCGNYDPKYKVECHTNPGIFKNTSRLRIVISIQNNDKLNGKTVIYNTTTNDFYSNLYYESNMTDEESNGNRYKTEIRRYSPDGKSWLTIPKKGVQLPKTAPLYLECFLNVEEDTSSKEEPCIDFAGNLDTYKTSLITCYEASPFYYYGPVTESAIPKLNLIKGTGSAHPIWDW